MIIVKKRRITIYKCNHGTHAPMTFRSLHAVRVHMDERHPGEDFEVKQEGR